MSDIVGDKISDMLCHCVTVPTMFAVRHLLLRLDTWQPPERRFYQSSDRVQPTGEGPPRELKPWLKEILEIGDTELNMNLQAIHWYWDR